MVSLCPPSFGTLIANQQLRKLQEDFDKSYTSTVGTRQRKATNTTKIPRSGISLSTEQKIQLIELIQQRPQIWDANSEGFRSNQSRQTAFNEVAQTLSDDGEILTRIQVQEEWGKLRYCFTRIVKKLVEEAGGGEISEEQIGAITWPYFRPMGFLLEGVASQVRESPTMVTGGRGHTAENEEEEEGRGEGGGGMQENQATARIGDEMAPLRAKNRRRRREVSRKNSQECHEDSQNQSISSANDLLMSQMLGMNAQDLLLATLNSQQLLSQIQPNEPMGLGGEKKKTTKREGQEEDRVEGGGITAYHGFDKQVPEAATNNRARQQREQAEEADRLASVANVLMGNMAAQQRTAAHKKEETNRRKRKNSNLDFLLGGAPALTNPAPELQFRPSEPPMAMSTPVRPFNKYLAGSLTPTAGIAAGPEANQDQQQQIQPTAAEMTMREEEEEGDAQMQMEGEERRGGGSGGKTTPTAHQAAGKERDLNESFGHYIVQQLKVLAKKNELLAVQLRKELVDVCYKYEMRVLAQPDNDNGDDNQNEE